MHLTNIDVTTDIEIAVYCSCGRELDEAKIPRSGSRWVSVLPCPDCLENATEKLESRIDDLENTILDLTARISELSSRE
jgi:hypothetical protein